MNWTQAEAIELCKKVEAICPTFGCHVALTGGLLYKQEPRKDCDLLFYRIRQAETINIEELWRALSTIGINVISGFGWCFKATYNGKPLDCLFPEEQSGSYIDPDDAWYGPSSLSQTSRKSQPSHPNHNHKTYGTDTTKKPT